MNCHPLISFVLPNTDSVWRHLSNSALSLQCILSRLSSFQDTWRHLKARFHISGHRFLYGSYGVSLHPLSGTSPHWSTCLAHDTRVWTDGQEAGWQNSGILRASPKQALPMACLFRKKLLSKADCFGRGRCSLRKVAQSFSTRPSIPQTPASAGFCYCIALPIRTANLIGCRVPPGSALKYSQPTTPPKSGYLATSFLTVPATLLTAT